MLTNKCDKCKHNKSCDLYDEDCYNEFDFIDDDFNDFNIRVEPLKEYRISPDR